MYFYSHACAAERHAIEHQAVDQDGRPFIDSQGKPIPLKISLTCMTPRIVDLNVIETFQSKPVSKLIKFGETVEINVKDYFPNSTLADDIFIAAFFASSPTKPFLSHQITTRGMNLHDDDIVTVYSQVCYSVGCLDQDKGTSELYQLSLYREPSSDGSEEDHEETELTD